MTAELGAEARGCQAGQCSTMAIAIDPAAGVASLESLEMVSASAAEVGTAEAAMTVDDFRIQLWDGTPAIVRPMRGTSAKRRRWRSWLLIAAAGAVACAEEEEPRREIPPISWSGEHLDYAPQEGAYALCAGTLPYASMSSTTSANRVSSSGARAFDGSGGLCDGYGSGVEIIDTRPSSSSTRPWRGCFAGTTRTSGSPETCERSRASSTRSSARGDDGSTVARRTRG